MNKTCILRLFQTQKFLCPDVQNFQFTSVVSKWEFQRLHVRLWNKRVNNWIIMQKCNKNETIG